MPQNSQNHFIAHLVILVMAIVAGWYLVKPGYFSMHDDLQIMRFNQLERCFTDGQIPCRWVPDMGAGYGFPLFNYYSPLPYYFGMIFRWMGLSFMTVTKITFLVGFAVSGIAIYWLVTRISRSKLSGLTASILYLWAPYRSVQIFVRGALAESFALAFFPLVLLSIWEWTHQKTSKFSIWVPLALAGLYLSHNIMAMWFTPVLIGFAFLSLIHANKLNIKSILHFIGYYIWGLAIAGFFIIPAILEQTLIKSQTLTQDYYNFRLHFASYSQLFFSRQWGYGPSRPGPIDDMSFQIGIVHWILGIISLFVILFQLVKHKFTRQLWIWGFFAFLFVSFVFMTHSKSVRIWEIIPVLSLTQFPWRLLALINFTSAILGSYLVNLVPKTKLKIILTSFIAAISMLFNWQYFKPDQYDPKSTDSTKLINQWDQQRNGSIRDFLPKTVQTYDIPLSKNIIKIDSQATSEAKNLNIRSDYFSLDVEISGTEPARVIVPIFYFPRWEIVVSDQPVQVTSDNELGLISFVVPPGKHIVTGWLRNTPVRLVSNFITLLALIALIGISMLLSLSQLSLPKKTFSQIK